MTIKEEALQFTAKYIHNDMNDPIYVAFCKGAQCEAVQALVEAVRSYKEMLDSAHPNSPNGIAERRNIFTAIEAWERANKND